MFEINLRCHISILLYFVLFVLLCYVYWGFLWSLFYFILFVGLLGEAVCILFVVCCFCFCFCFLLCVCLFVILFFLSYIRYICSDNFYSRNVFVIFFLCFVCLFILFLKKSALTYKIRITLLLKYDMQSSFDPTPYNRK